MAIGDDFSVDRGTGNIRHTSGSSTYTVLQLHRWLQGLADDAAAAGDDELDITDVTPSERSTDNIITLLNGYNIDDTAAQYLYDGSITQDDGDTIYAGLVVVGTLASGSIQIVQNNALLTDTWSTHANADAAQNIILRCLVEVRTSGADIDGRRLRIQSRAFGYTYDEFSINGTALGNNVAAISTTTDLNNQTASGTVGGWTINNTEGYQGLDVNADATNEYYYSQWDPGAQSINDLYERAKYIMRAGSAATIHGMDGQLFRGITHSIPHSAASGNFTEDEILSWGSGATAGTGILLAFHDTGTAGTFHIQHLTGAIVTNGATITGGTSSATATSGTPTARTINKNSFVGTTTGSAIIGAFGVGVKPSELTASDVLTDLSGATITPPNNVTFTVAGLVSGEDRVFVGPWNGSSYDDQGNPVPNVTQMTLNGALTGAAVASVVVTGSIPADTPTSGTIRVVNNAGYEVRLAYSSWSGSTFTLSGTYNFSGSNETANASSGNGVYVSYIDKLAAASSEAFTCVYASDRNLLVRVRDGASTPIKTFVTSATLGSAGGSATAIRTSDS